MGNYYGYDVNIGAEFQSHGGSGLTNADVNDFCFDRSSLYSISDIRITKNLISDPTNELSGQTIWSGEFEKATGITTDRNHLIIMVQDGVRDTFNIYSKNGYLLKTAFKTNYTDVLNQLTFMRHYVYALNPVDFRIHVFDTQKSFEEVYTISLTELPWCGITNDRSFLYVIHNQLGETNRGQIYKIEPNTGTTVKIYDVQTQPVAGICFTRQYISANLG